MRSCLVLLFVCVCSVASAQPDTLRAPYLRFPDRPPLHLLLRDSSTIFTRDQYERKKPLMLMLFSTDCGHCQQTARELVKYKDSLHGLQIIMATLQPVHKMNAFIKEYGLDEVPNLTVGRDVSFFMPSFFNVHHLPFTAFYDRRGKLISVFEGSIGMTEALRVLGKKEGD